MPNEPNAATRTGGESTEAATPAPPPDRANHTAGELTPGRTPEPTLGQLVSSLTARAPDIALALVVVIGMLGAGLIVLLASTWWRVVPAFVLLSAVGGWGIADRERESQGRRGLVFAVVRAVVVLGSIAAAATLFLIFTRATMGRWIS